jgi:hypothetical protein
MGESGERVNPPEALPVLVNPLAFLDLDQPWSPGPGSPVTAELVLDFMCPPGIPSDTESLAARYRQISSEERRLSLVPDSPELVETLVWPLRHAKAAFITGNYPATIGLSGTVAEALAVLLFRISRPRLHGGPMEDDAQEDIFGRKFVKLEQGRRLRVMRALRIIDEQSYGRFDQVRDLRNKYVHHVDRSGRDAAADAVLAFNNAVWLACFVVGQDFKDGKLVVRAELLTYLRETGLSGSGGP